MYYITDDKAFLDLINERDFTDPTRVTKNHCRVAKNRQRDLWLIYVPDNYEGMLSAKLSASEQAQVIDNLVGTLDDEWWSEEVGELDGKPTYDLNWINN